MVPNALVLLWIMLHLHRLRYYLQRGLRADLPRQADIPYLGLFLCPLSTDQHFFLLLRCFLLPSAPCPCLNSSRVFTFPSSACSGIDAIFLLNSLSPLPPPVRFLLGFELSQEFPLGQSWPPAMFAWLPAHQNGLFCFEWLFL